MRELHSAPRENRGQAKESSTSRSGRGEAEEQSRPSRPLSLLTPGVIPSTRPQTARKAVSLCRSAWLVFRRRIPGCSRPQASSQCFRRDEFFFPRCESLQLYLWPFVADQHGGPRAEMLSGLKLLPDFYGAERVIDSEAGFAQFLDNPQRLAATLFFRNYHVGVAGALRGAPRIALR